MSKMKSVRKPPLPRSPIRLRPTRVLQPNNTLQTPPVSLAKSQKPNRPSEFESEMRPEYLSISCELRALAKKVQDELGEGEAQKIEFGSSLRSNSSPLFERGRFYEEYSARRNERLKRKKGLARDEGKASYNLGVTMESAKRSTTAKKLGSMRKSISATETPRYMLRSMSKENKKPPLPLYSDKSILGSERKVGPRRVTRI
ncbi:hypothetical protein UlMin_033947 [Ulmus minor]